MPYTLDINADIGEGFGPYVQQQEEEMYKFITSANIACGFHAGDFLTIKTSIAEAKTHGVAIGAHPGYPDRYGFGRRAMQFTPEEIYAMTLSQVGTLLTHADAQDHPLQHVKAHGALYHHLNTEEEAAQAFAKAIAHTKRPLTIYTQAGSELAKAAQAQGLITVKEGFADRRYDRNGNLVERTAPNATIHTIEEMIQQIEYLTTEHHVETICFHSDHEGASAKIVEVIEGLKTKGYTFRSPL